MFTSEERLMLLQVERAMDAGEQPFVRVVGQSGRYAFTPDVLAAAGVASGSTVSSAVLLALMEFNLARLTEQVAYEKGQKLVAEELPG